MAGLLYTPEALHVNRFDLVCHGRFAEDYIRGAVDQRQHSTLRIDIRRNNELYGETVILIIGRG